MSADVTCWYQIKHILVEDAEADSIEQRDVVHNLVVPSLVDSSHLALVPSCPVLDAVHRADRESVGEQSHRHGF